MIEYKDKRYESQLEQALDIGRALLARKFAGPWQTLENIDPEEEQASLALWLVERFRYYEPSKGAVSTWTYKVFSQWAWERVQERKGRWGNEVLCSPILDDEEAAERGGKANPLLDRLAGAAADPATPAEFSGRAEEIVQMFPERTRDAVRLCLGDGLNNPQAAELLGVSRRTVWRRMREANEHIPAVRAALEAA